MESHAVQCKSLFSVHPLNFTCATSHVFWIMLWNQRSVLSYNKPKYKHRSNFTVVYWYIHSNLYFSQHGDAQLIPHICITYFRAIDRKSSALLLSAHNSETQMILKVFNIQTYAIVSLGRCRITPADGCGASRAFTNGFRSWRAAVINVYTAFTPLESSAWKLYSHNI